MQTSTQGNVAAPQVSRHAHVIGVVHPDEIDHAAADRSRTEHDAPRARLRVRVDGSLFATSYLLFLVNLHLTQSRT